MSEKKVSQHASLEPATGPHGPALAPQKRWFIILSIIMVVWIGGLVTMYFTTVWPQRHSPMRLPRENDVDDHHPTTLNG